MRGFPHPLSLAFVTLALLGHSGVAAAQQAAPAAPVVVPSVVADPSSAAQDPVGLPLRLSLLPAGSGGCGQPSVDDAGTILPVQPHVSIQLTLRLTLEAFSNLGCPGDPYRAFDAGVGGGFTYSAPLAPNLSLVGSLGTYRLPSGQKTDSAGVDLMWKSVDAAGVTQSTSVGVGVKTPTGRGVRVTGRVGGTF